VGSLYWLRMTKFGVLRRFVFGLAGLFVALAETINRRGRDFENRIRFRKAVIKSNVCLSQDCLLGSFVSIDSGTIINHSRIGDYTYICRNALIQNTIIGRYCSISHDVICGLGQHPLGLFSTSLLFYRRKNVFGIRVVTEDLDFDEYDPIYIGNDVWIGARAIIMDGVHVGNGAVIACGAVVTHDVPPYAIVAGVPAKVIKFRAAEEDILQYEKAEWWHRNPHEAYAMMTKLQDRG